MSINIKTHAKDYLLEYSSNRKAIANWLNLLIQRAINNNGIITEEDKMQIFSKLLEENNLKMGEQKPSFEIESAKENIIEPAQTTQATGEEKLILKKIIHISGVNALDSGQSISFSDASTVIYGLNGTGKSGYFKIINELSGGDKAKTILSNIYRSSEPLEVNIDFCTVDELKATYKWDDKYLRGVYPFNQIKVFDSEYLPIFLDKRESSVNVEPLGLHLFQIITSIIDEFKSRLEEIIRKKNDELPDLESLVDSIHSESLKSLLQKTQLIEEGELQLLESNKCFSVEESKTLEELKITKQALERDNTEDSCKVLNQEIEEISQLSTKLSNLKSKIQNLNKIIFDYNNEYLAKKKLRDTRATQFKILQSVPSKDTNEWQDFIESAEEYGKILDTKNFSKEEKCIHCHQLLGDDALALVQTYSEYLNDKSQQNYKEAARRMDELKEVVSRVETSLSFSVNLQNILLDVKNEKNETFKDLIDQVLDRAIKQKDLFNQTVETNLTPSQSHLLHTLYIQKKLKEIVDSKRKIVSSLQQSNTKKKQEIEKLVKQIHVLEDRQIITKFKTQVESHFDLYYAINKIQSVNQKIGTTRTITNLGTTAHNELLTESIRKSFEKELQDLGRDIRVTLEPAGGGKGSVFTKLMILGNDVNNILSDGEKKSVGLALFLAEIQNNTDLSPIVFDDPVTSLDHDVADDLAKKILQLSETRQVVIFTHNKLFKDSLIYWGSDPNNRERTKKYHVCKNYSGGCSTEGKHIITYEVKRNSRESTGIIIPYKMQDFAYFLNKAKIHLIKDDYDENDISSNLRLAIDYYVDEKILADNRLRKDKQKNHNTNFEDLKSLNPDADKIDKLAEYYNKVSGDGGIHQYQDYHLKPMRKEDFEEIINFLESN